MILSLFIQLSALLAVPTGHPDLFQQLMPGGSPLPALLPACEVQHAIMVPVFPGSDQ